MSVTANSHKLLHKTSSWVGNINEPHVLKPKKPTYKRAQYHFFSSIWFILISWRNVESHPSPVFQYCFNFILYNMMYMLLHGMEWIVTQLIYFEIIYFSFIIFEFYTLYIYIFFFKKKTSAKFMGSRCESVKPFLDLCRSTYYFLW